MGSGADEHYEQVSQLFSTVTATNNLARIDNTGTIDVVIRQQGFTCYDDSITAPLTVQAGDIVEACVFNPTNGNFFLLDVGQMLLVKLMAIHFCKWVVVDATLLLFPWRLKLINYPLLIQDYTSMQTQVAIHLPSVYQDMNSYDFA